jgi:hypothetical protein
MTRIEEFEVPLQVEFGKIRRELGKFEFDFITSYLTSYFINS